MSRSTHSLPGRDAQPAGVLPGRDERNEQGPAPQRRGSTALITPPPTGLPTAGAVAVAVVVGFAGAALNALTGGGLQLVFGIAFVTGCVLAAVLVRRRSLAAAVVLPPLAYVAVALAAGLLQRDTGTSWLMQEAFELVNALISGAPVLLTATAAAGAVVLVRLVLGGPGDRLGV